MLPYYDSRDELTIQGNLIFKGQLLVVPAALRTELMSVVHASHLLASEENARMSVLAAYDNTGQGLHIEVRSMSVAP